MNLQEYQIACKRTCPDLGTKLNLSHMVMGMSTELQELDEALALRDHVNIGEEVADFYWYMINYMTFRGIDANFLDNYTNKYGLDSKTMIYSLYDTTAKLTDLVKKNVAYSKDIDVKQEESLLIILSNYLQGVLRKQGILLSVILQNNIDKLLVRFPIEFNKEQANNRDLNKELTELKK
jgi:NTP pyrophosphatase (non-canonical NTP hydrolase)